MGFGTITLADYPADMIRLACRRCQRRGQYQKTRLIADLGAGTPLPDVRVAIANCPRAASLGDACGVYFVDLSLGEE